MEFSKMNIRDNSDEFERYKMPVLDVMIKHKGSYRLTYIKNIDAVAKALHIASIVIIKHFGSHLNTQSRKCSEGLELKGLFETEVLAKSSRFFIQKYLICKICTLPELKFQSTKNKLDIKCLSCGNIIVVESIKKCTDKIYKSIHEQSLNKNTKNAFQDFKIAEKDIKSLNTTSSIIEWSLNTDDKDIQQRKDMNSPFLQQFIQ